MLNYPSRYPLIPNADECRWCWEDPLAADSWKLSKHVDSSAEAITLEGGHCHQSYSCREAAHRLRETVRILQTDAPSYEQLNAIQKLHLGECDECEGTGRVGDMGPGGIYHKGRLANHETARCDECGGSGISKQNKENSHP